MRPQTILPSLIRTIAVALAVTSFTIAKGAETPPKVKWNLPKVEHPLPLTPNSAGVYGLEHTHIFTAHIEDTVHFYVDLLGFTQTIPIHEIKMDKALNEMLGFTNVDFRHTLLNMPGGPSFESHVPMIEVWEVHGSPINRTLHDNPTMNLQGKGYNAYRVKDLDSILARLKSEGIRFVSKPIRPAPDTAGIYVVDPDGQVVELDQYRRPLSDE